MAKQNAKSAATDIQSLFDPQGYQNVFKTWAGVNERLTGTMVDAATKATDIARETTQDALGNIREVAQVREDPADYGKAYSDFVQKQMDLFTRSAQSWADATQKSATEMTETVSEAGHQIGDKVAANAQSAADRATSAAKKAA